ncbi:TetR/AcrR family transcriptional regulator [Paenibacillus sp. YN15]|uniref:TetR/AcrR family transcriptional regulator n=1 Tax=Paenibacillus sp. YN15 TaxID=1742774 RepID=UPI000DCCBF3B|nr:TetR/AcrR family transcriptional regulator [Paenibacillus sp. YN15]RAV03435.1 TetR/AcrR family transcriptional regulator [Paenibacillus sp. YN15]
MSTEEFTIDRRIVRTRRMLRDALIDLIEERGLEGLTVRDLTQRAGLNRGTFYLHYKDIQDLLEQSKEEVLKGLTESVTRAAERNCGDGKAGKTDNMGGSAPPQIAHSNTLGAFEYFARHSRFFAVMMGPKGDPCFFLEWKKAMMEDMTKKSMKHQPDDSRLPIPRDYLVAYIVSAHLGLIQHWLESGMKLTPQEMAALMTRLNVLGPKRIFQSSSFAEPPE